MNPQGQRLQTVRLIMEKDSNRYGYLTTEPFYTQIVANYQFYSNEFWQFLLKNIQNFGDYHNEVMLDDFSYGQTFKYFLQNYQNCCQYFYQMQMQIHMQNYQSVKQGLGQPGCQSVQNMNEHRDEGRRCYGKNRGWARNYGHWHEGQKNHESHHYGKHHRHGHGRRRHHDHNEHALDENRQFKNQKQCHRGHRERPRCRKQRVYQHSISSSNSSHSKRQLEHQNSSNNNFKKQLPQPSKKLESQRKKHTNQRSRSTQPTSPQRIQKPQPKATKYSLKQMRQFVDEWSDQNRSQVSKDLIQQVNEFNSCQKGEISFEQGSDSSDVGEKKLKELTEEEKIKFNRKQVTEVIKQLVKESLDVGYERIAAILSENVALFDFAADSLVNMGYQRSQYASEYATFARRIAQLHEKVMNQSTDGSAKYSNTFRTQVVTQTQSVFKKCLYERVRFRSQAEKASYVSESRQKLLKVVTWVAQLIKKRVLKSKIARACMEALVHTCLQKYYRYRKKPGVQDSNYHVYFEALLEFVSLLSRSFDTLDKHSEYPGHQTFDSFYSKITALIDMSSNPEQVELKEFDTLSTNDIFIFLQLIDSKVFRRSFTHISLKLIELRERRQQKWTKVAKGDDKGFNLVEYEKTLNNLVRSSLEEAQKPEESLNTIYTIVGSYSQYEYMAEFIGQIQNSQRQQVNNRMKLFRRVLSMNPSYSNVKSAWFRTLENMAEDYEVIDLNMEILGMTLVQIAVAYHEPKEYLRPKTSDEQVNSLYDRILAWRTRK